jgi:nucleoid-associated protein YgaU
MTSDAKIGLLLGLAFIFIIAFIINGLPSLHKDTNNNELTTNMVNLQNTSPGIAARERKAHKVIDEIRPAEEPPAVEVQSPSRVEQDIRFTAPLPKSVSTVKEAEQPEPAVAAPASAAVENEQPPKTKRSGATLPAIYVVREGDNLAAIAKKFYGREDAITITAIFNSNRKLLSSPNEIYEGQKLTIPILTAPASNEVRTSSILAGPMLEEVESIGQRHLVADSQRMERSSQYVVRQGDSLWRIAAEQLGDGNRYNEIAKLNAKIIDDENNLTVGMRLTLPVR